MTALPGSTLWIGSTSATGHAARKEFKIKRCYMRMTPVTLPAPPFPPSASAAVEALLLLLLLLPPRLLLLLLLLPTSEAKVLPL